MDFHIQKAVLDLVKDISNSKNLGKSPFGDIFIKEISSKKTSKYIGKTNSSKTGTGSMSIFVTMELPVKQTVKGQVKKSDRAAKQLSQPVTAADVSAARSSGKQTQPSLVHTGGNVKKKKRTKRRERDQRRLKEFIQRKKTTAATEIAKKSATKAVLSSSSGIGDRKKEAATEAVPSSSLIARKKKAASMAVPSTSSESSDSDSSPPLPRTSGKGPTTQREKGGSTQPLQRGHQTSSTQVGEPEKRGQKGSSVSLPQTPHLTSGNGKKVGPGATTLPLSSSGGPGKKKKAVGRTNPPRKKKGGKK